MKREVLTAPEGCTITAEYDPAARQAAIVLTGAQEPRPVFDPATGSWRIEIARTT